MPITAVNLTRRNTRNFHEEIFAQVLVAEVAITNGVWFPVDGTFPFSVTVEGITTATVQLHVSNAPAKPADATVGSTPFTALTANGAFSVQYPVKWCKLSVTAWTSGTINAYLYGLL